MTTLFQQTLDALLRELLDGPREYGWMLNTGDAGLLRSLDALPAAAASRPPASGAAPIAAHVEHLRYGLALMNRWLRGEPNPFAGADWTQSWTRTAVTDAQWDALRQALLSEARALLTLVAEPQQYSDEQVKGIAASLGHLAYHFGAIRQIDRSMRGPSAVEARGGD
jgi:hypothetical protein